MSGPVLDPEGTVERLDQMRAELSDLKLWLERAQLDPLTIDTVEDARRALAMVQDMIEAKTITCDIPKRFGSTKPND